jgi:DNA-directed RNA polymerase subunit omega
MKAMARITIEDCMEKVPNRFQLVQMAAIRAKQLKKGARPLVTAEDNKAVVTSLREIAEGLVKPGDAEADVEESQLETASEAAPAAPTPTPGEAEAAVSGEGEPTA